MCLGFVCIVLGRVILFQSITAVQYCKIKKKPRQFINKYISSETVLVKGSLVRDFLILISNFIFIHGVHYKFNGVMLLCTDYQPSAVPQRSFDFIFDLYPICMLNTGYEVSK